MTSLKTFLVCVFMQYKEGVVLFLYYRRSRPKTKCRQLVLTCTAIDRYPATTLSPFYLLPTNLTNTHTHTHTSKNALPLSSTYSNYQLFQSLVSVCRSLLSDEALRGTLDNLQVQVNTSMVTSPMAFSC